MIPSDYSFPEKVSETGLQLLVGEELGERIVAPDWLFEQNENRLPLKEECDFCFQVSGGPHEKEASVNWSLSSHSHNGWSGFYVSILTRTAATTAFYEVDSRLRSVPSIIPQSRRPEEKG
jgi:hypothetical protein